MLVQTSCLCNTHMHTQLSSRPCCFSPHRSVSTRIFSSHSIYFTIPFLSNSVTFFLSPSVSIRSHSFASFLSGSSQLSAVSFTLYWRLCCSSARLPRCRALRCLSPFNCLLSLPLSSYPSAWHTVLPHRASIFYPVILCRRSRCDIQFFFRSPSTGEPNFYSLICVHVNTNFILCVCIFTLSLCFHTCYYFITRVEAVYRWFLVSVVHKERASGTLAKSPAGFTLCVWQISQHAFLCGLCNTWFNLLWHFLQTSQKTL